MPKTIRITQIDGKLPNLALMRLSAYHKALGDIVYFTRRVTPDLFEPQYDTVYGSAIFSFSRNRLERFKTAFPHAIIGGTGSGSWQTLEDIIPDISTTYDYSLYPDYKPSIGFLQRGCRLKCKFCVVPKKEGKPSQDQTVAQLWRGPDHPKHLHILDNDFFGVPGWERHIRDIIDGNFKICLNQGINVRLITPEAADAISQIEYRDDGFNRRRLYTAWDNLGDETIFFRGIETLEKAGIPPNHVMAYMLIGYDPKETWDRIFTRFNKMTNRGILPYPMVFDPTRRDLKRFQRWVVRGLYKMIPFEEYNASARSLGHSAKRQIALPI